MQPIGKGRLESNHDCLAVGCMRNISTRKLLERLSASVLKLFRNCLAGGAFLFIFSSCGSSGEGLFANIYTTKGLVTVRLEMDKTPMTVASFVGLAEGTIDNAAFEPDHPFFDGTVFHRVVEGHVIQAGAPQSDIADGPGYTFPNEIHASLSHDHAGALGMANGGPHTNSSQFYITLGDRSYLDLDYIVFGEVVEGLEVVTGIVADDVVDSVRIVRVGDRASAFRPTNESFREMVDAANDRVRVLEERRSTAEANWIRDNWPNVSGPDGGILSEVLVEGSGTLQNQSPRRIVYTGILVRFLGHVIDRKEGDLEVVSFGSDENGVPGFVDPPMPFVYTPDETVINPGLDSAIATMLPGERRVVIVPASHGYGRAGLYTPERPGEPRFVISPNTLLVYEVEVTPVGEEE